jgi:hypothetical protein
MIKNFFKTFFTVFTLYVVIGLGLEEYFDFPLRMSEPLSTTIIKRTITSILIAAGISIVLFMQEKKKSLNKSEKN